MNLSSHVLAALIGLQPAQPEIQRPASLDVEEPAAPAEAEPAEAEPTEAEEPASPEPTETEAVEEAPEPPETETDSERFTVVAESDGPPFYDESDTATLRARHGVKVEPLTRTQGPRWRCLIADPACGRSFEINALSAYTYRGRQGSVNGVGEDLRWSSGRAQYDFWMNFPVVTEVVGNKKFTRMTLAPKGGLIFSDGGSTWGNLGMAFRYWMGRGRWAPSVEFSSALSFKIGEQVRGTDGDRGKWQPTRGPMGFTADVGFGLGGFGAIVFGGQYDSPLAREEVPEKYRTAAAGAFFIGFRGNILWGGPAAAAVATHVVTQRTVETP